MASCPNALEALLWILPSEAEIIMAKIFARMGS